MQVVLVEHITKVMSLHAQQVDNLAERGIDLFCGHINPLRASQSEPTDGCNLILRIDREHLVDESRLLQFGQQLLDIGSLAMHLLLVVLLQEELLLEQVEVRPEPTLVIRYLLAV